MGTDGCGRGQFDATVAANVLLCREHYRLTLRVPNFPATEPGQFIQILSRDVRDADEPSAAAVQWEPGCPVQIEDEDLRSSRAMLRRPFSLAGRRDLGDGVELEIIHRIVGVGTAWMGGLQSGQRVNIIGPLGNRFDLPRAGQHALLVGGGVGIPPMLYLAQALGQARTSGCIAFVGAVTRDLLPVTIVGDKVEEFAHHGVDSFISTDDGSMGFRGYVTQAMERYLDSAKAKPQDAVIYTCGPELMMKRVAAIAQERGIECQVAVERAMACGMGTCQSCCIRVKKPDPSKPPLAGSDWCYRLACTDGPIFRGSELLW